MIDQFLQQCMEEIEKVASLINKQKNIEGCLIQLSIKNT